MTQGDQLQEFAARGVAAQTAADAATAAMMDALKESAKASETKPPPTHIVGRRKGGRMGVKVMKQIMVDRDQEQFLRKEARRTRRSMSLVVRDALDLYATLPEAQRQPVRPRTTKKKETAG